MNLTYIEKGSLNCPLIVLSDFTENEILSLKQAIRELADGGLSVFELRGLPDQESGQAVCLMLISASKSRGVVGSSPAFTCELTPPGWDNVEGLLEPFSSGGDVPGFQWLDETGEISLLISHSGKW